MLFYNNRFNESITPPVCQANSADCVAVWSSYSSIWSIWSSSTEAWYSANLTMDLNTLTFPIDKPRQPVPPCNLISTSVIAPAANIAVTTMGNNSCGSCYLSKRLGINIKHSF